MEMARKIKRQPDFDPMAETARMCAADIVFYAQSLSVREVCDHTQRN